MDPSPGPSGPKTGSVTTAKNTVRNTAKTESTSRTSLESKETSIIREMRKELDILRDLAKRVKAEGVREGIERVYSLFGHLSANRNEQKAGPRAPAPQETPAGVQKALGELRTDLVELVRDSQAKILEAFTAERSAEVAPESNPTWSEVTRRQKKTWQSAPAPTALSGIHEIRTLGTRKAPDKRATRARPPLYW